MQCKCDGKQLIKYIRTLLPVRWNFSYELLTFRLGFITLDLAQNGVFESTSK